MRTRSTATERRRKKQNEHEHDEIAWETICRSTVLLLIFEDTSCGSVVFCVCVLCMEIKANCSVNVMHTKSDAWWTHSARIKIMHIFMFIIFRLATQRTHKGPSIFYSLDLVDCISTELTLSFLSIFSSTSNLKTHTQPMTDVSSILLIHKCIHTFFFLVRVPVHHALRTSLVRTVHSHTVEQSHSEEENENAEWQIGTHTGHNGLDFWCSMNFLGSCT